MKGNTSAAVLAVICSIGLMIVATWASIRQHPPTPATARILACDPDFFYDKWVTIPVEGTEPGKDDRELVYRVIASEPPVVVCHFTAVPRGSHKLIVGHVVRHRKGEPVSLEECRLTD